MNTLLALALLAAGAGQFEGNTDVGDPARKGSVEYDAGTGQYRVAGGGVNMWFNKDAFYFVWKRISGDVRLSAEVQFAGTGGDPHRKAGLIVRQSLDPDAPYADAILHGAGLTSLQYRETAGTETKEVQSPIDGPLVLRLERRGDSFTIRAGKPGEPLQSTGPVTVAMKDPVYVGLAVCAHNADAIETAVFSKVRIETGAEETK